MSFYTYVLDEKEHALLLDSVGESVDTAPDRAKEDEYNRLFDTIKSAGEVSDDVIRFYSLNSKNVGYAGNELLKVMRKIAECEEQGRGRDATWYVHELCVMVRGLVAAGWKVLVKPQSSGMFRCVEIEGYVYKV